MHLKPWLVLAMSASLLAGCATEQTAAPTEEALALPVIEVTTIEEPVQEETPVEEPPVDPLTALAASVYLTPITHSDSLYATDDPEVLLAQYAYNLLSMEPTDPDDEGAVALAESFNAQFDMWEAGNDFDQMSQWATEQYEMAKDEEWGWVGYYTYELNTFVYQTAGLISLQGQYYSFTGGAHGNSVLLSWLFDMTTGTFISPLSLAKDPQMFADAVADELIAYVQSNTLEGYPLEELYWDDYQMVISSWDSYCVYFNEEGMHVSFSPYELAAYAAGAQEFTLAYETILPYLSDTAVALLELAE